MKSFRKLRDEAFIREVFNQYASKPDDSTEPALDASSVGRVLETGFPGDATALIAEIDLNKDGRVDCEEFVSAVMLPSAAEAWAKRGPWCEIVAGSLPWDTKGAGDDNVLRSIAELSDEEGT